MTWPPAPAQLLLVLPSIPSSADQFRQVRDPSSSMPVESDPRMSGPPASQRAVVDTQTRSCNPEERLNFRSFPCDVIRVSNSDLLRVQFGLCATVPEPRNPSILPFTRYCYPPFHERDRFSHTLRPKADSHNNTISQRRTIRNPHANRWT